MSLPRLRNAKQVEAKLSNRSVVSGSSSSNKTKNPPSGRASSSTKRQDTDDADLQETLAREAEILSLLTVLNAPVMNEELPATLQAVKAALYAREYASAFSRPDYLHAYCARWVPGRALAYRDLILDSDAIVSSLQKQNQRSKPFNVLCVGGGAGSEVLALASLAKEAPLEDPTQINVTAVDCGDWSTVLDGMADLIKSRWKLEEDSFHLSFRYEDILETYGSMREALGTTSLITSLFTTNELFAASRVKTLSFLNFLTEACSRGTLLLIVESVGSYSEMTVAGKEYPLDLILDQTLAGKSGGWRIVEKDQGRWYRVPEESKKRYQLQLENTHMLVRLYERL